MKKTKIVVFIAFLIISVYAFIQVGGINSIWADTSPMIIGAFFILLTLRRLLGKNKPVISWDTVMLSVLAGAFAPLALFLDQNLPGGTLLYFSLLLIAGIAIYY